MHAGTTVYGRGRGLQGPVGVGWCACDIINHVQVHLVGFGGVGWVSVGGVEQFGPCGGGVSGHSVNLRDQCSVCDVVTVRMRRSSGRSRS